MWNRFARVPGFPIMFLHASHSPPPLPHRRARHRLREGGHEPPILAFAPFTAILALPPAKPLSPLSFHGARTVFAQKRAPAYQTTEWPTAKNNFFLTIQSPALILPRNCVQLCLHWSIFPSPIPLSPCPIMSAYVSLCQPMSAIVQKKTHKSRCVHPFSPSPC